MRIPLHIPKASKVLVAGIGGGFDAVCALPIVLALRELGHTVHLANASTSSLDKVSRVEKPLTNLYLVGPDSRCSDTAFPFVEGALSRWFKTHRQEEVPIWCFARVGVRPTREAFQYLQQELKLDALILVDGGVDGLFQGDEHELGTPSLDSITILSAASLGLPGTYVSTAFGIEGINHTIPHADALRRMADLVREQACQGVSALLPGTPAGEGFMSAIASIHSEMEPWQHSVIASSIRSAMRGEFGHQEVCQKAQGAPVWVSPLTLLYWFFDLGRVAALKPYAQEVAESETVLEVAEAIARYRETVPIHSREDIPI